MKIWLNKKRREIVISDRKNSNKQQFDEKEENMKKDYLQINNRKSNLNNNERGGYYMNRMNDKDTKINKPKFFKGITFIFLGIGIILAGIYWAYLVSTPQFKEKTMPDLIFQPGQIRQIQMELPPPEKPKLLNHEEIFNKELAPEISWFQKQNKEVLEKCLSNLDEQILNCYEGIDRFLDELTSFSTKLGMLWESAVGDREAYVRGKFKEHIFSEEKLGEIVNNVLLQYIEGISANMNEMYIRIKANITRIKFDIPNSEIVVADFVKESFNKAMQDIPDNSNKVLWSAVINFTMSQIGSQAAVRGATYIYNALPVTGLSSLLAPIRGSILTPAFAMVGSGVSSIATMVGLGGVSSVATGSSVGSIVPGFGTVVGAVIGIGVGYIIEEHMDSRFKEKMRPEIESNLNEIKNKIHKGFEEVILQSEDEFLRRVTSEIKANLKQYCYKQNQIMENEYLQKLAEFNKAKNTSN